MLNEESLSTVRLTCKTLEGATFESFTKTFANSYCCVYYETRWLSLRKFLHGSPRLIRRLNCINFTTNPLERHDYIQVQIAPGKDFDNIHAAQKQFDIREANEEELYEPFYADRQASPALIHRVLLDLSERAPHVSIEFDLADTRFFRDLDILTHQEMFLAIASTSCAISELTLSRCSLDDLEQLTTYLGSRLLSCTSHMYAFTFRSADFASTDFGDPLYEKELEFLASILRSAYHLFSLTLELGEYEFSSDTRTVTDTLLFSNTLAHLEHLSLHATTIPEEQLSTVIASCKRNLNVLNLGGVRLINTTEGWATVFRSLATLPKLEFLRLQELTCPTTYEFVNNAGTSKLDFQKTKHGETITNTHIVLSTKFEVAAGLKDLLSGNLLYYEVALTPIS